MPIANFTLTKQLFHLVSAKGYRRLECRHVLSRRDHDGTPKRFFYLNMTIKP